MRDSQVVIVFVALFFLFSGLYALMIRWPGQGRPHLEEVTKGANKEGEAPARLDQPAERAWNQTRAGRQLLLTRFRDNPPVVVKGIYLTAWTAGSPERMGQILRLLDETDLNAVVIDVKDQSGYVLYPSRLEAVREAGALKVKIQDLKGLLERLKEKGIYPIARLVVFDDPVLARARPELAIRNHAGTPWADGNGFYWTNPYNEEVWDYNLAIAREVAELGFREIQFDYVRFPDNAERVAREAVLENPAGLSRVEAITFFLRQARAQLGPRGVYVSADVFGLTTSSSDDMGIGQDFRAMAQVVDYISPMIYPSHYYNPGIYGLPDPEADPYNLVRRALEDARRKAAGTRAIIRPYLQDFSLKHKYGRSEIEAQIRAAHEQGIKEWILWNASNHYTPGVNYRAGENPGDKEK
ncbi:MAG: putative glycoside hydrolase [Firmicutes bacterium]|nr:putative glycoside hydrolase [Bacillota bacterium]MCL5039491.1 putative glycoside hydrolase [Bacillota bacterium]